MQDTKSIIYATFPGNNSINELWTNGLELDRGSDIPSHNMIDHQCNSMEFIKTPRKYDSGPLLAHWNILGCIPIVHESRGMRIPRWINWWSRWLRGRRGTRPRATIYRGTGIEVSRRRPLVIFRKLPLSVEMLESVSHARGTNRREKRYSSRAAGNTYLLLSIYFFLYVSLSLYISAATQPAGNEILFRAKLVDRSICTLSLIDVTNQIFPPDWMRINSRDTLKSQESILKINSYAFSLPDTYYFII